MVQIVCSPNPEYWWSDGKTKWWETSVALEQILFSNPKSFQLIYNALVHASDIFLCMHYPWSHAFDHAYKYMISFYMSVAVHIYFIPPLPADPSSVITTSAQVKHQLLLFGILFLWGIMSCCCYSWNSGILSFSNVTMQNQKQKEKKIHHKIKMWESL